MKAGDKVIINPCIKENTWNRKRTCSFYDFMMKKGVFTLQEPRKDDGTFFIDGYYYDEDWLLPVPLFKPGDKVKIKSDLRKGDQYPFGVSGSMEDFAGKICTVKTIKENSYAYPSSYLGNDGFEYTLEEDELGYAWSSPMFDLTKLNTKHSKFKKHLDNESRLQEQESPLRRGSREFTSGVRCRVNRARIKICSPGYQEVSGRG